MKKVVAMILAGGRGKRMDILCHARPKPALPFGGRFRVIDYTLSNCLNSRIDSIAVLVDHLREEMARYLTDWYGQNSRPRFFHILPPGSGSYRGTADAVYQNRHFLERSGAELVLVLAGDHVYQMDYRQMLAFHQKSKAVATVGVVPLPPGEAHRFGIVHTGEHGRITGFEEKPRFARSNLASMGIYLFNKEALLQHLAEDAANPDSPHDFGYAIMPNMSRAGRVFAYQFKDYWQDIGTTEAYYEASMGLLSSKSTLKMDRPWQIFSGDNHRSAVAEPQVGTVLNSIISPGCVVRGRVENSILSPGVWVDDQAVVRNSVLMDNVSVGFHSVVEQTIADEDVQIGSYCFIGFGDNGTGRGITLLGEGVTVPPHTAVGRGCTILPGVKPDDFTAGAVLPGRVIGKGERALQMF